MTHQFKKLALLLSLLLIFLTGCGDVNNTESTFKSESVPSSQVAKPVKKKKIGIAWTSDKKESYQKFIDSIEATGADAVIMSQVIDGDLEYEKKEIADSEIDENGCLKADRAKLVRKRAYNNSNVSSVYSKVDAVLFPGGEDICTTLFEDGVSQPCIDPEDDYNITRDVSDYLLMAYCLDYDIPILGICRGMQMLACISGGEMIVDIPNYFKLLDKPYNYEHRMKENEDGEVLDFVPHSVDVVDKDSFIFKALGKDVIDGAPSWHHQAVSSAVPENLKITATTTIDGVELVEAVERTDKVYAVGYQFHPEAAIRKHLKAADNASDFMSYEAALLILKQFVDKAR